MNTNKETFRLADYKNIPMKTNTEGKQNQEQHTIAKWTENIISFDI